MNVPKFLNNSVRHAKSNLCAKIQIDLFNRFDRTPACDRQTDRHRDVANTALQHSVLRVKFHLFRHVGTSFDAEYADFYGKRN